MDDINNHDDQVGVSPINIQSTPGIGNRISSTHAIQQDDNSSHAEMKQTDPNVQQTELLSDFINPSRSFVQIRGRKVVLDNLNITLDRAAFVQRSSGSSQEFPAYTPLATAVNCVLVALNRDPITERDLVQLQHAPWFAGFTRQYLSWSRSVHLRTFDDITSPTAGRMHMVLKALIVAKRLPQIHLGIVVLGADLLIHAYAQHHVVAEGSHTAWLFCDMRNGSHQYFGIGHPVSQQQQSQIVQRQIDSSFGSSIKYGASRPAFFQQHSAMQHQESEEEYEEGGEDDGVKETSTPDPNSTSPPRRTSARVRAQQVPLPVGLSARSIIENYPHRLHYNNVLKVALRYNNQQIADADDTVGKTTTAGATGVIKRINTAHDFIELEYGIKSGAFRTIFDRARKANGIKVRGGKEKVSAADLAIDGPKIDAAMAWVIRGGSDRVAATPVGPTGATAVAPMNAHAAVAAPMSAPATTSLASSHQSLALFTPYDSAFEYSANAPKDFLPTYEAGAATSTNAQGSSSASGLATGSQMIPDGIDTEMSDLPTDSGNTNLDIGFGYDVENMGDSEGSTELDEYLMSLPADFSFF